MAKKIKIYQTVKSFNIPTTGKKMTRRQYLEKCNLERREKNKDTEIKLSIFKALYFENNLTRNRNITLLYKYHIKNFVYYLLDKLKYKNKILFYYYYYFRYKYINNIENSFLFAEFLSNDFLLYKFIWPNVSEYYKYYKNKTLMYLFTYKKRKKLKNKNINFFKYEEKKFLKKKRYIINNYDYTNSFLILLNDYLEEIKIRDYDNFENIEIDFFEKKILNKENTSEILNEYLIENNEELPEYSKFSLDMVINYNNYVDFIDIKIKENIFLLQERKKILNQIYIEELLFNETDNPFYYINTENLNFKKYENDFFYKLINIHNLNLNNLNVPFNSRDLKIINNEKEDELSKYYNNLYDIKCIEESKLYVNIIFILEFYEKTCIQFIELCLYKIKDNFNISYIDLVSKLHLSLDLQLDFINFYNFVVKHLKKNMLKMNLLEIKFILNFLELLYLICKNFNIYNNIIFNFNLYKLISVLGTINIFDKNFIIKIFFFKNEKNLKYLDFLFNIYSYSNMYINIDYYFSCFNFVLSNSIYFIKKENKYFYEIIKKFLKKNINLNLEYKYIYSQLYYKRIQSKLYFYLYKISDIRTIIEEKKEFYGYSFYLYFENFFKKFDYYYIDYFENIMFNLNTYNVLNVYKFIYYKIFKSLNRSFINHINLDLLRFNITEFKINIKNLHMNMFIIYNKINMDILKDIFFKNIDILNLYTYNFWRIFNIDLLYCKYKNNLNIINFFEICIVLLFSSLTVHAKHILNIYSKLKKYIKYINIFNPKKKNMANPKEKEIDIIDIISQNKENEDE